MPKDASRRFLSLDTDEVSLVDTPANQVEFLVTKNQEDGMSATAAKQDTESAVKVPVETEGDVGAAVAKSLEHVNALVDKITKFAAKSSDGENDNTVSKSADEAKSDETPSADSKVKEVLKAIGVKDDDMEGAIIAFRKAIEPPAADDSASEESPDEDTPLTIGAIRKAAAMTPARVSKIQEAMETLKLILEGIGHGQNPKANTPQVGTHPNSSKVNEQAEPQTDPVVKSASEEQLIETLKSLGTAVGTLTERIETIEKSRSASNSVEEDADGTDSNVKKDGSIWKGVL
jgi:hypothetical protein